VTLTRKVFVSLASACALLAVGGAAVRAQQQQDEPADAIRLSLSECLARALESNLDLRIAKKDPEIAHNNVLFQKAQFDPLFSSSVTHSEDKTEPSQVFVSAETKSDDITAGVSGLLNFGASWSAGLESTRIDSPNPFRSYNPSYSSGLALGFKLPLLKGLGKEATTANLVIARRNIEISDEELRRQATTTLQSAENAYWNLRAAREAQKVAEQALQLAKDLYDLNKKKVEVGTLAPIEITQAEANVASNVEGTINAKQLVQNAEDELRRQLAIPQGDPMWSHTIIPTEKPQDEQETVDVDAAITEALKARPEMVEAKKTLENSSLSERAARNAARHQLDLTAGVTPSGNNLIDVTATGTVTGGLTDSLSEIPKFRNYSWNLGLTYTVPIRNRAAEANYANAKIAREKQELSVQNTEAIVRVDVRTAVRAVGSGYERIVAARKNVELQQKKLDAEQKKFENGMSTSFEVFTFQTDLRNAQLSLIQALLDYNKALADLERAKGTLLEAKGLSLASDAGK
jgi:outer membrane protein